MDKTVFTNGCFDILHPGHVDLLERARKLGTRLVVGINSDESVRRIKGPDRPFTNENDRKAILSALRPVDDVIVFNEATPERLIRELRPDVLVKGGDWSVNEIIGADIVLANGGEVLSLPLIGEYSSSKIVEAVKGGQRPAAPSDHARGECTAASLLEHIGVLQDVLNSQSDIIAECANSIYETFDRGGKVLLCGNGGSAADAQHIAAEFVGRYETERKALPAIALTTDTSALTALANDYDFERIFARQVEALAVEGDCLIAISTSGNSPNVIAAVMTARKKGCTVVGLTGADGKKLASLCDASVLVPSSRTARIQEAHITVAHIWCEIIDAKIAQL